MHSNINTDYMQLGEAKNTSSYQ